MFKYRICHLRLFEDCLSAVCHGYYVADSSSSSVCHAPDVNTTFRLVICCTVLFLLHCYTHLTTSFSGQPGQVSTRWINQIFWILLKQRLTLSALPLLVGCQEGHPARKKSDWWDAGMGIFWSEVQIACLWFSWCHCHPIMSASANSRMVYPSGADSPG